MAPTRAGWRSSSLAERVRRDNWNRLLDGDVAMLDGSRSTFPCHLPDPVLERDALQAQQDLLEGLDRAGLSVNLSAGRRSLRALPAAMSWDLVEDGLTLDFSLPPGAYATSLLRELVMTGPGTISEEA